MSVGLFKFVDWFNGLGKSEEKPLDLLRPGYPSPYLGAYRMTPLEKAESALMEEESKVKRLSKYADKLQQMLVHALKERKTASVRDFEVQLQAVIEAHAAYMEQAWRGSDYRSELNRITRERYDEEVAKLRFLVYEDKNVTVEEAEAKVKAYYELQGEIYEPVPKE